MMEKPPHLPDLFMACQHLRQDNKGMKNRSGMIRAKGSKKSYQQNTLLLFCCRRFECRSPLNSACSSFTAVASDCRTRIPATCQVLCNMSSSLLSIVDNGASASHPKSPSWGQAKPGCASGEFSAGICHSGYRSAGQKPSLTVGFITFYSLSSFIKANYTYCV